MGLHWIVSALAIVAWPRRSDGIIPASVEISPETSRIPLLSWSDNPQTEADFWDEIGRCTAPEPLQIADATKAQPDLWSRSVEYSDGTSHGPVLAPVDNSARAYYEWRMQYGLTEPDEERIVYNDYVFQCRLNEMEPLSIILFGRGLVRCGCKKLRRVAKYGPDGRRREPNVIEWPLQLGMQ